MINEYTLDAPGGETIASLEHHALPGNRGLLARLWVHPDYRGQGLARTLLGNATADADAHGITLESNPWGLQDVDDEETDQALYSGDGPVPTASREHIESLFGDAGFAPEDDRVGFVRWLRQPQRDLLAVHAALAPLIRPQYQWADFPGLSAQQMSFQRTHPAVRQQILTGLLQGGNLAAYKSLLPIHRAQGQVDRIRASRGHPSPYAHPRMQQPWGNPARHPQYPTMQLPRVASFADMAGRPLTWDEIGERHPEIYGDREMHGEAADGADGEGIGWAAAHLAFDRPGHEEPDEQAYDLDFQLRHVPVDQIDFAHHGGGDSRVASARRWYRSGVENVVPPVLVHRHGVYQVADGHHRGEAASLEGLNTIPAYVAYSPHENEPFSEGGSGPYHGARVMHLGAVEEGDTQHGLGHGHTAPASGPTMDDPEDAGLPDIYDHPEYYVQSRDRRDPLVHASGMENWQAVKAARGNPDAQVKIYRAVPHGIGVIEGNTNPAGASWVSASPSYARRHAEAESCPSCGGDMQVISGTARAGDLHNEGYLEEWGYTGEPIRDQSALMECPEGAFEARKAAEAEFMKRHAGTPDESGLKAAGIAVIAMDTGRVLMQQRSLNPMTCPCGLGVTWDESNGYQHDDGSVSHDGEFYGQSVSDLLDQGHPETCPCCRGMGDDMAGSECTSCDGSGVDPEPPLCETPCREDVDDEEGLDKTAALEFDPNEGTWEFPGGKLDPGESARNAAIREFREEVGQDLPPGVFVGAWVSPGGIVVSANRVMPSDSTMMPGTSPLQPAVVDQTMGLDQEMMADPTMMPPNMMMGQSGRVGSVHPSAPDPDYLQGFHDYLDRELAYSPEEVAAMPIEEQRQLADGYGHYVGEDDPYAARYHLGLGGHGDKPVRTPDASRTVRVLRIEKPDGSGPFAYKDGRPFEDRERWDDLDQYSLLNPYEEDDADRATVRQRQPYADRIPERYIKGRVFGFLPQHRVGDYFTPTMLRGLHDKGYGISQYDVHPGDSVVLGRTQVGWRPQDATRVSHTSIPEHFGLDMTKTAGISPIMPVPEEHASQLHASGWTQDPQDDGFFYKTSPGTGITHHLAWGGDQPGHEMTWLYHATVPDNDQGERTINPADPRRSFARVPVANPTEANKAVRSYDRAYIVGSPHGESGLVQQFEGEPEPQWMRSEPAFERLREGNPLTTGDRFHDFKVPAPGQPWIEGLHTPLWDEPAHSQPLGGLEKLNAAKAPVYKGFIYLIQRERDIDLGQREIANPDDPDGDMTEQSAWWDIEHAKKNPALRKECKKGTPWDELEIWADKSVRANREIKEGLARLAAAGKCSYCKSVATKEIKHSEGMGLIAVCDKHLAKGKEDAENCTPDGTRDPSNIDWIHDASVRVGMPLTQQPPVLMRTMPSGEGAGTRHVRLPSGDWIAKSPETRHLQSYPDSADQQHWLDLADKKVDLEEFASRLGRALSDPKDEALVPEAVRSGKASDTTPTVYVRRHPGFQDLSATHMMPEAESHVDTPRGRQLGYLHAVLGDSDKPNFDNVGLTGEGKLVSIDHTLSTLPQYAEAMQTSPAREQLMRWNHDWVELSPFERHFLTQADEDTVAPVRNPLASGDTDRALEASETLRPWAKSRGRESWLDAAQQRMKLLGEHAGGSLSLFPYPMAHESMQRSASARPAASVWPAIRKMITEGRPQFSIRTPAEVSGEHHDRILDNTTPDYHEERQDGPDTPKVYAYRVDKPGARSTGFLVPLRHTQSGQTGWIRGRTDQEPSQWRLYRDSEIEDAVTGRKPERGGKPRTRRTRRPNGSPPINYNRYGEQAKERYTRGYAQGTPAEDWVEEERRLRQPQEGDVPLDEEGHQEVEPQRDTWSDLGVLRGYADEEPDQEKFMWTDLPGEPEFVKRYNPEDRLKQAATEPWWSYATS